MTVEMAMPLWRRPKTNPKLYALALYASRLWSQGLRCFINRIIIIIIMHLWGKRNYMNYAVEHSSVATSL